MIDTAILSVATLLLAVISIPIAFFFLECVAGSWPARRRPRVEMTIRPPVAILVPAHNESAGIADTLRNIRAQMRDGDRLVVVADNCDDDTAQVARAEGAEVVERADKERRGKGYALDAGIQHLRQSPPRVVVFVDADCRLAADALDSLAAAAFSSNRPVQARNLQIAPADAGLNLAVAEFAFLVKNQVRPLGLARLGLPCLMTGTGMALPWSLLKDASLASGHQVEDMKFGLDLARAGHAPLFCPNALVTSLFPYSKEGADTQRQRWEGGHLSIMRYAIGRLLSPSSWARGSYAALLLDVTIPPLTLLVFVTMAIVPLAAVVAFLGIGLLPLVIAAANVALLSVAVAASWLAHGRTVLPARSLAQVPLYAASKFKLYPKTLLAGNAVAWVRTDRTRQD